MSVQNVNQSLMGSLSVSESLTKTARGKTTAAGNAEVVKSEAYSVEISASVSVSGTSTTTNAAEETSRQKGLTTEQIGILKDGIEASQALMIKVMTRQNEKLQGYLSSLTGKLNFDGVLIDTSEFALPEVATTPEEAAKAIAPGGAYSVNAVADRVFGMAAKIANGDPEKLETMRAAVEKGFQEAGIEFNTSTGASGLPDICSNTHDEIMKRFDDLKSQLTGGTKAETGTASC